MIDFEHLSEDGNKIPIIKMKKDIVIFERSDKT
jgi:hypothetical protein